MHVTEPSKN